ncbi:hypothetical protein C2845_PM08G12680 [Panicum miliaceum]|uniref:Ubiquitin fusion degradation protein 1 n=1 Tax=Panicum miliaceum TaxID=4540 RepID=A0A3L6R4C0_PANMI|nr:hypothetical protein C2845_PM08G12680 [Panicum miliaceum]
MMSFFDFEGRRSAYHGGGGRFEQTYRCYPASSAVRPHLEAGDKVILPASALHRLASLHIEYPMQFELRSCSNADSNDDSGGGGGATAAEASAPRVSHCGVLEFVADEGTVMMPGWMMENLRVRSAALPKGTYVKLRPHAAAFLEVSNLKAVLEKTLRAFSCFTTGDTIVVAYNNVETRPATAVSIIDTDCEVDFAPPLDDKETEKPQQPSPAEAGEDNNAEVKDEPPEFKPFTGSAKRLDGKASELQASSEAPSTIAARSGAPSGSNGGGKQQTSAAPVASGASCSSARQKTGKLVFGSSASNTNKEAQKAKDEPKFQAFTGKSYSLKK